MRSCPESDVRDLILTIFILGSLPWCFRAPHLGLLLWAWIGYMNPHRFSWGFAYNFPFVQIAALVTLVGMVLSSEKKRLPMSGVTVMWLLWIGWTAVTSMFLLNPVEGNDEFWRMMKTQLMILVTLLVITDHKRFNWLMATVAFAVGFFGVKGGAFVLATGGSYRVWGPPGSFIEGNNELALALLVVIPLMRYLQTQSAHKWVRRGLTAAMMLSGFAVVGSYSRGALLGGAAMLTMLWLRSRSKLVTLIGLVIVAGSMLMFMPQQWFDRMGTINTYEQDDSALGRINAWNFAYNLAKDRPITGGGFEAFTPELFLRYAPNPTDFHDAHSIYFEVLAEHGFVGLFLFLGLAIAVMLQGQRIRSLTRDKPQLNWAFEAAGMLQVSFAGFGVGGAFLGLAYFDLPYHIMAMMIIVQAVVRRELQQSTANVPAPTYAAATAMRRQ
jgi:probable O-glycosylation ligase (exosortase A-associated)